MGITSVERSGEWLEKVVFKIENVAEFFRMSNEELEENGIIFEAGNCILKDGSQIPATWKYFFECFDELPGSPRKWIGGFVVLHRPTDKSDLKSARASYSVSLSSGGKYITSFEAEQKEFAGISTMAATRGTVISINSLQQKTREDTVEVTLVMKVFSSHSFGPVLKIPPSISAAELKRKANSDLVKMLESGDWSDVKIRVPREVGGEVDASSYTRKAHKTFLTARSVVFAAMFAKDSTMIEAKTGEVVIKDLSPMGLDVFLHYLYTGEVLEGWVHVVPELLNAAEKYDCGEFKQFCGGNIMAALSTNNALELYKLAKLHGLLDAAETVLGFISKNTKEVIDQVV